jgi:hypothetical protein
MYEIQTVHSGQWSAEIGEPNEFDTEAEAQEMIERLKSLGDDWSAAEYRVRTIADVQAGYQVIQHPGSGERYAANADITRVAGPLDYTDLADQESLAGWIAEADYEYVETDATWLRAELARDGGGNDAPTQRLIVEGKFASREAVARYLPANYSVVGGEDGAVIVEGQDSAGWTAEGYVIPRLSSGLMTAKPTDA